MEAAGELVNVSVIFEINNHGVKLVLWFYNHMFDTVPSSNSALCLCTTLSRDSCC